MALKHFSHFKNSVAATEGYEVVSPALFEVYITLPTLVTDDTNYPVKSVGEKKYGELLLEHVRSVSGLDGLTPTVGTVVQKYKFAERHYAAAGPDKTSLELALTFTMNLDDAHQNYIYNMLRKWYDLIYNPQNGQMLTKKQYTAGSFLEIYEHDRNGAIWRKVKCFNFFPSTPPTGLNENNYDSVGDAKTVSITFMVDNWVEHSVGMEEYRAYSNGDINSGGYNDKEITGSDYGNIHTSVK